MDYTAFDKALPLSDRQQGYILVDVLSLYMLYMNKVSEHSIANNHAL